jgi:sugar lactone lactonase YvrE
MKKIFHSAGLALLMVTSLGQPAFAQPQSAGMWKLDRTATHEGLSSPVGMAYDAGGNLYVANWSAGTVMRFTPKGERRVFASGLSGPSGLAVSSKGDVYVASYNEDLVWRFTPNGDKSVFVRGLATPAGLSFDARGRLLIANRRTHQLLAAHPDGRIEVAADGLQTPVGAAELPNGDLLISNIAGGISLVSGGQKARTINTDLSSPGPGIVATGADAAYVVDYGGTTVSRVDRQGARTVIADGLSSPVGLAVAPDGSLMVATWGANAAFQIRRPRPCALMSAMAAPSRAIPHWSGLAVRPALLQPANLGELEPEGIYRFLGLGLPGVGLHVRQNRLQRITELSNLPSVASDVIQNLLLQSRV